MIINTRKDVNWTRNGLQNIIDISNTGAVGIPRLRKVRTFSRVLLYPRSFVIISKL